LGPKSYQRQLTSSRLHSVATAFCGAYSFKRIMKTTGAVRTLICAAGIGDLAAVQMTLRKAPDAARDWRPIMEASYKGFAPIVELLAKYGADVNAVSSSERNRPLHRAAERGHKEVVEVLLQSGADIEARGTWLQITPLVKAAFEGRAEIVELLLKRGARVDRFAAAALGKMTKAHHGVDSNGLTTLHYCAGSALGLPQLPKIAERLIAAGAEVNAKPGNSGHTVTPIKLATRNQPVAEVLLDNGADPNDLFRDVLLSGCNYDLAEILLSRGAELNPVLWGGETLLHVSIHWGRLSSAEWLLQKGASPNTKRDKDAWTPLHQAASRGVASIVEVLLKHGSNPATKDANGQTALDIAREKRRAAVVKTLSGPAEKRSSRAISDV
jgi:ankyrin repeat protein